MISAIPSRCAVVLPSSMIRTLAGPDTVGSPSAGPTTAAAVRECAS